MTKVSVSPFRKFILWLLGCGLLLINLLAVSSQVQAASDYTISRDALYIDQFQVDSAKQTIPLYNSPTSTTSAGQLSTAYSRWQVTGVYVRYFNNDFTIAAYDLGNNQWLKLSDVPNATRIIHNANGYWADFFSNNTAYQLFSDPQTTQATDLLSPAYNVWKIVGYAANKTNQITAYNLGANNWVQYKDPSQLMTFLNYTAYYTIDAGVTTYDVNSNPTGTIQLSTIYGSTEIHYDKNNQQMVRVGTDQQWVYLKDTRHSNYPYQPY